MAVLTLVSFGDVTDTGLILFVLRHQWNPKQEQQSGSSHYGFIWQCDRHMIGSICVTSPREPKARTVTLATLAMVSLMM